ncbi:kinase-like protein [Piromyces finnis]|uniref:Kinase-like protein n=1 Tax=Piromyces finnis TaxID=1754191 RepID=A0A1Y1VJ79_9FUNG|nr:kinase-like protein [Piromyces finnis]|eukprot:ORX56466.1 kinase-like protein [Piromyces finnis]
MASRVHSLNLNGKIPNILLKEQKQLYNQAKLKNFDDNLNINNDSIDNLKKLTRFSSYNENNIKNSANTLKWEEESDEYNLADDKTNQNNNKKNLIENNLQNYNRESNYGSFENIENQLSRSVLLRKNYEDLTQLDASPSIYYDHHEEDKFIIKCPSCPEKVFRKPDDMKVFDNANNDEIDFYTNEKIVSNNCWSEISKLRHFASNLELYTSNNKKSKLTFNFLEEFALNEGVNYLSDFGFHDSHDHITDDDGFYPLRSSNDYIHEFVDTDSESDEENDSDNEDLKNYISQKRKMVEKMRDSNLSNSSSIQYQYSMTDDFNGIDESKNTLISSFNSLQINQCYSDDENNKILEIFDFIKEYKTLVNSVSIKYENNNILINEKPLENRIRHSLDEYQEIKTVGNGAYGKLVECIHLPTNKRVILKKIPVNNINHWYINNIMTMEEYSLRKNIHPRIITLYDAFLYYPTSTESLDKEKEKSIAKSTKSQTLAVNIKNKFKNLNRILKGGKKKKRKENGKEKNEENNKNSEPKEIEEFDENHKDDLYILVTESIGKDSMDLYDYIESVGPIPEDNVRYIFAQIIEAIYFMSKNGFSHGDIKDENILINPSTFQIKLIDFGSATTNIGNAEIPYSKFRGTRKYQAPNIYKKDVFDPLAQDVWSLGVMFFVMLFAADPFTSPEEAENVDILEQLHENIQYIRVEKDMDVSNEAVDLIMKMLEKDETVRITLEEIIYHNFFRI